MANDMVKHGPNLIHPETPSAVGSRNSIVRDRRDEYAEGRLMVDEEVDKILNHIHAKLPPEVASRLEVMGTLKSKLHNYFNQNVQNMTNRYLTTMEDELAKRVRNLVDAEEMRGLNRYTPRPVSYLLDRIAGGDKFNTGEIEKSIVNMYGHLHGHTQREMNDLETYTNSMLRRKTDVGALLRGENAYAIVKCSFRDAPLKPETVFEVKLALNILDSELISPIYSYQVAMSNIIKDLVGKSIQDAMDKELDALNASLVDEGKNELTPEERIFERIKALDNHVSDDTVEGSKRYTHLAKKVFDAVEGLQAEIDYDDYDPLRVRENVFKIVESDNIRNRGFNTAVNALTHVLDWSRMGYQHIENFKAARKCVIREYADTAPEVLPDERYAISLTYYTSTQLNEMRAAYAEQMSELDRTIMEVWNVLEQVYNEDRKAKRKEDWETLYNKMMGEASKESRNWLSGFGGGESAEDEVEGEGLKGRQWNEIIFVTPKEGQMTTSNPTYKNKIAELRGRFGVMRDRVQSVFKDENPEMRVRIDERLNFLEAEMSKFSMLVNPFHVNPGLLLEVDIVSVKRKSTTMMNMANVLNEFLSSVSKGFADAAFASFSRRRSTQRADLAEGFGEATGEADDAHVGGEH